MPLTMTRTDSDIGDGKKDLFGDGNVPEAFRAFPSQHICNEFCNWFGLKDMDKDWYVTK
jgi:hypothetical protein